MKGHVRRIAAWVLVVAGMVLATISLVEGFTEDPRVAGGWGGGVAEALLMGLPLALVGWGLRSDRTLVRRRTAIAAVVLALLAGFVLVMQLADPNETTPDRLVSALGVALYAWAASLELPAWRGSRFTRTHTA